MITLCLIYPDVNRTKPILFPSSHLSHVSGKALLTELADYQRTPSPYLQLVRGIE